MNVEILKRAAARQPGVPKKCDKSLSSFVSGEEITFHESKTFMDYLHGDVKDEEAELACAYEYARESRWLLEAAKQRDELLRTNSNLSCERAVLWILKQSAIREQAHPMWEWRFLMCKSFPTKDWNELSPVERKRILNRYETRQVSPLLVPDLLWTPQAMVMLAKFKQQADANTPPISEVLPGQKIPSMRPVPATMQKHGSVYWCLFEVDFSESKDRIENRFLAWLNQPAIALLWQEHKNQRAYQSGEMVRSSRVRRYLNARYLCLFEINLSASKGALTKQFKKWLALTENRKQLKRYSEEKRGATGQPLDRLKDLAAWRLYRENGNNCEAANKFANQNRKKFKDRPEIYRKCKKVNGKLPYKPGDPRPFYNAKATKNLSPVPTNQADLFSCDEDYRHAKMKVVARLSDSYPREFKKPSPAMARAFAALKEFSRKR